MTINIILCNLPHAKAILTSNSDGSYSICVNKNLSREQIQGAVRHELTHIKNNDFSIDTQATLIERMLRDSDLLNESNDMEFFYQVV